MAKRAIVMYLEQARIYGEDLRLFLIDVRENLATLECGHKGLEVPLIKVAVHATQRFIGGANYGK